MHACMQDVVALAFFGVSYLGGELYLAIRTGLWGDAFHSSRREGDTIIADYLKPVYSALVPLCVSLRKTLTH